MSYDPELPWGGRGSPCSRAGVSFPDLADCRECDMCGFCETHGDCVTDWNHIAWFAQFASPGEPVCGSAGAPGGRPPNKPCALPAGHGGDWHMARQGDGWPAR